MKTPFTGNLLVERPNHELELMLVDDNPNNLRVLSSMLKNAGYKIRTAINGQMAITSLQKRPVDLILLDVNMPVMNGFELSEQVKEDEKLSDIPIIFITALSSVEDRVSGFEHGAVDFITKPFLIEEVEARVKTHLHIMEMRRSLNIQNEKLREVVNQQVMGLIHAHMSTVMAMVEMAEARDDDTGKHILRISKFSKKLAELIEDTAYRSQMCANFVRNIEIASPLHDIGKIGIRDNILLKPGKLTPQEFEGMKAHVTIGADKLKAIYEAAPENTYLHMGEQIARYHHEKWDGSGYMHGLTGENIPLSARIMAIVDVYDALRSRRVYKEPFPHEKSIAIMTDMSGSHFDPTLYAHFKANGQWFAATYDQLSGGRP